MFGKGGGPRTGGSALSVIGADVTVVGDVAAQGDLHLDGTVQGNVACHVLVQGASGRVTGTVRGQSVRLAGTVEGSVAAERLVVEASARITGDVTYRAITIEEGAVLDGRMTHAGDGGAMPGDAPLRLIEGTTT